MAIEVSEDVETMMNYDYMMYKNASYGDKWFYAFILNVEHIGRKTTRVYFEVDPLQTYMFDVDIKTSHVVREHETNNPENIYPEGLQVGSEYESVKTWDVKPYPFYFLVFVTKTRVDTKVTHNDDEPFNDDGTFFKAFDPLTYYWYPIPRDLANIHIRSTANGEDVTPSI